MLVTHRLFLRGRSLSPINLERTWAFASLNLALALFPGFLWLTAGVKTFVSEPYALKKQRPVKNLTGWTQFPVKIFFKDISTDRMIYKNQRNLPKYREVKFGKVF